MTRQDRRFGVGGRGNDERDNRAVRTDLESGATTSRALVQDCIERATDASGEGALSRQSPRATARSSAAALQFVRVARG